MPGSPEGYSGTPLWRKIGITEGARVALIDMPDHVPALLKGAPPHHHVQDNANIVWWFVSGLGDLHDGLADARSRMLVDGMLWVSWPKKTSELHQDMTELDVRRVVLATDLVDVKVCAVDEDWSALKLVVRRELR